MDRQISHLEKLIFHFLKTKMINTFSNRKHRNKRNEDIFLLYVLNEFPLTLENIGNRYNITRERVRQIVVKQSRKLSYTKNQKKITFDTPIEIEEILLDIIKTENFFLPLNEKNLYYLLVKYLENIMLQKIPKHYLEKIFFQVGLTTEDFLISKKKFTYELNSYKYNQKLNQKLEERKEKFNLKFQKFYKDIKFWNNENSTFSYENFLKETIESSREINIKNKNSGNFFSTKNQSTIFYESGLELIFYNILENADIVKKYYCQPFSVDYFYDKKWRKYYPDVLVQLDCGKLFIFEIKPILMMGLSSNRAKWEAMAHFCREKKLGFLIADYRKTLQQTLKVEINLNFEKELIELLNIKNLSWSEIKFLMRKHGVRHDLLVKLIYKYNLEFFDSPFLICR